MEMYCGEKSEVFNESFIALKFSLKTSRYAFCFKLNVFVCLVPTYAKNSAKYVFQTDILCEN